MMMMMMMMIVIIVVVVVVVVVMVMMMMKKKIMFIKMTNVPMIRMNLVMQQVDEYVDIKPNNNDNNDPNTQSC